MQGNVHQGDMDAQEDDTTRKSPEIQDTSNDADQVKSLSLSQIQNHSQAPMHHDYQAPSSLPGNDAVATASAAAASPAGTRYFIIRSFCQVRSNGGHSSSSVVM